jgi:hypothetical protein
MRTQYAVALALLAGVALGAAAIQTLHAQAAPKAYVVAQNVVKDEAGYMRDFAPSMSKSNRDSGRQISCKRRQDDIHTWCSTRFARRYSSIR